MASLEEQENALIHQLSTSSLELVAAKARVADIESEISAMREALMRIQQARHAAASHESQPPDIVVFAMRETTHLEQLTAALQDVLRSDKTQLVGTQARRVNDSEDDDVDDSFEDDVNLVKNLP